VSLYFISGNGDGDKVVVEKIPSSIPKKRQEVLKWNGWGFKDSGFEAVQKGTDEKPDHAIAFTGSRYELGNGMELPYFYDWVSINLGIDPSNRKDSNPEPTSFPSPIINEGLSS